MVMIGRAVELPLPKVEAVSVSGMMLVLLGETVPLQSPVFHGYLDDGAVCQCHLLSSSTKRGLSVPKPEYHHAVCFNISGKGA